MLIIDGTICGSGTMPWTAPWTRRTLLYKYAQKHVLFMQTGLESMIPRCEATFRSTHATKCARAWQSILLQTLDLWSAITAVLRLVADTGVWLCNMMIGMSRCPNSSS